MRTHGGGHNTSPSPHQAQALATSLIQNKNRSPRRKFLCRSQRKKMTEPEADPAALSIQKVHVQIGRIRPISDRYPQRPTAATSPKVTATHGCGTMTAM